MAEVEGSDREFSRGVQPPLARRGRRLEWRKDRRLGLVQVKKGRGVGSKEGHQRRNTF